MPRRPLRECIYPGCRTLVVRGRCDPHQREQERRYDEERGSATERGYDWRWAKAAKRFLREHPLCHYCALLGRVVPATCVDHATPHKGNRALFWDRSNWRSSCTLCNSRKGDRDEPTFVAWLQATVGRALAQL
jgi:5-methylcytosine-specific restriction protein A